MLIQGCTSKGAYFITGDLPANISDRDDLLLQIMGSPDVRQIDGIWGAHPLTRKVAIVSCLKSSNANVDFFFVQLSVQKPIVDTKPNCGNILAGVGLFAVERGVVEGRSSETRVRINTVNTATRAELVMAMPVRTARPLFDGVVFARGKHLNNHRESK